MFRFLRNLSREDWLLYILFFMTTLGRHVEPFAIVGWMIIKRQTGNVFLAMTRLMPLFIYILISSIIGFIITQFPMDMFIEQFAQLVVYMSIYFSMMVYYRGRYNYVFSIYCNLAFILAVLGIIQYLTSRFLGIQLFVELSAREGSLGDVARAQSWMGEPSYMALYLTPAIVYNSMQKGIENLKSLVMITSGLLSFSPVFQFVLGLFIVYYIINAKLGIKRIILYTFTFIAFSYVNNNYNISDYDADDTKKSETFKYWGASFADIESANLSTYALLKNLKIATMAENRVTGTGIGSHGYSHDKYYHSNVLFSDLNKYDAFSLGTRIFSEFGFIGLIMFILFFYRGFNKRNFINVSTIFYIIYVFLRGGHYTIFGLQFFIMIFYFTSKYKINNYGLNDSDSRS